MAIESKWEAVPPQTISSDGTSAGAIAVPDTSLFKVKQKVTLFSDSSSPVEMEVKRVPSPTVMFLGLVGKPIHQYADLSSFTVADNTRISAAEQPRPAIPPDAYERATYEEEPVMAKRSVLVDKHGRKYDENNPLPTTAQLSLEGDLNFDMDGFDPTNPDSTVAVGSEDGTKTGTKHALRIDSALDARVALSDGSNKAQVNASRELSVIDLQTRSNLASLIALLASGISVDDDQTQALLTQITNQLTSTLETNDEASQTILSDILSALNTGIKTDDDQSQVLLNDLKTALQSGVLSIGTDNGTVGGTKHVFVNNIKEKILKASDRQQSITYADAGTKDQRIVTIDYTSPTIGSGAGFTARKTISYDLVGTKYIVTGIEWSLT